MSANSAAPTYTSAYPPTGIRRVLFMISSMRGGGSEHQVLTATASDRTKFEPHLFLTDPVGPLLSSIPEDVKIHSFQEDRKWPHFQERYYANRYPNCVTFSSNNH